MLFTPGQTFRLAHASQPRSHGVCFYLCKQLRSRLFGPTPHGKYSPIGLISAASWNRLTTGRLTSCRFMLRSPGPATATSKHRRSTSEQSPIMPGGWASGWMTCLRQHSTFSCSSTLSHILTVFKSNATGSLPAHDGGGTANHRFCPSSLQAMLGVSDTAADAWSQPVLADCDALPTGSTGTLICVGPFSLVDARGSESACMEAGLLLSALGKAQRDLFVTLSFYM